MPATMTYSQTLIVTSCWCGISFAIPENLHAWLRKDERNHCHCPQGHEMVYSGGLQQRLDKAERQLRATKELLAAEERSHSATRGHLTKAKKQVHRAEHGVCPHCKRSFQNLARHMQSKHASVAA